MNADKFLSILQEEMGESISEPWATAEDDGTFSPTFKDERIENVLYLTHIPTGNRFEMEVRDVAAAEGTVV